MCLEVNCPDQTMSLFDAINRECYELVDQLITNGYDLDVTYRYGCTPLMLLLCKLKKHKVCLELIIKLIDAGADVNIKENQGNTALIYAMYYDPSTHTARMLIDAGADVNIKMNDGWTALIMSMYHNCSIYEVKMLVDAGADVNIKKNNGVIALLYAVKTYRTYSSVDAVKMLIEADF